MSKRSQVNAAWRDIKIDLHLWYEAATAHAVANDSAEKEARRRLLDSYARLQLIRRA